MLEKITLGEVALALAFLVALIASIKAIRKDLKKWIQDANKESFERLEKRMDELKKDQEKTDLENCKNYLVTFLSAVERDERKDEIEYQRFWEQYEHYQQKNGNSYIKHKVETLQAEHKL